MPTTSEHRFTDDDLAFLGENLTSESMRALARTCLAERQRADAAELALERERMRLASAGVAALGYHKPGDPMAPEYHSATMDDVWALQAKLTAAEARLTSMARTAARFAQRDDMSDEEAVRALLRVESNCTTWQTACHGCALSASRQYDEFALREQADARATQAEAAMKERCAKVADDYCLREDISSLYDEAARERAVLILNQGVASVPSPAPSVVSDDDPKPSQAYLDAASDIKARVDVLIAQGPKRTIDGWVRCIREAESNVQAWAYAIAMLERYHPLLTARDNRPPSGTHYALAE
jgi:hypothetical protein